MPGRRLPDHPINASLCRRCQAVEPAIVVRTEPLCKACFGKYVNTKVVKRLESFRVRHSEPGNERSVLLAVSLDACSVTLLHVVSQHLKGQVEKTGRTGFKLCVLYVNRSHLADTSEATALFSQLKERFPEHDYHTVELSDALSLEGVSKLFGQDAEDLSQTNDATQRLMHVLDHATSATSRQDTEQTLRRRLVVQFAQDRDCESIIWDYSATKLAERTLAETAKGRGIALPWTVADGESLHGVPFYHPLRELLNKELKSYVSFIEPPFDDGFVTAEVKPIVSTKNTTIDDLMEQYFDSVEKEYPSIVANVVRTTGKLVTPALSQTEQCELCNNPLEGHAPEKSRLCYSCIRMLPQDQDQD
ncbi:related to Cytoplasmic tRNA 2-thiolation protein 2 [Ramularia collo-cygni]|uniref:Cytoplasmic tRNA 2-thiolation protein 2 n=1 Tax=Ramularia collo-cygni TaxID=112498 RepID=A0A2D3VAM4_9PEZI|nr:related to Cytoplasmic tRNA 2-thiolation protein 2 [Ramularia collo-cygni]CZT19714.1 related to Cytoplasmic tRNA 2-thiolation protein 2 [Ramularia collo-cygni]